MRSTSFGRRFDNSVAQSDMKLWPFTVINDDSRPKVQVEYKGGTKTFMVLLKMKEIAEAYLGKVSKRVRFARRLFNLDIFYLDIYLLSCYRPSQTLS